ncbi:MAG TPA: Na(+)-translocating NADH-quinone reductase subunit A [Bacteroidales bacterium]|nr:Na(+)-translocating NADH-quinone reductase subunit A [Bacteroidales bacterium]
MAEEYKIKQGLNVKISGKAEILMGDDIVVNYYSMRPIDFVGLIPKLLKKEGEAVKRGEPVYCDKYNTEIKFTSPVSGQITNILRGEKRKLLEIIIQSDNEDNAINFEDIISVNSPESLKSLLTISGVWPFIKQRPYGIIANPNDISRDIFISFFDSAPLSCDFEFVLKDKTVEINAALKALKTLTKGKVYLNFKKNSKLADVIDNVNDYVVSFFDGPHPSGLAGTHINKIKPINKNEIVWTVNATDLPIIGNLLLNAEYNTERLIAIAGPEVKHPCYYNLKSGADISEFLKTGVNGDNYRVISGNVLTGTNISANPCLGFYDNLISIIPEGNKYEMFGWMQPGFKKFSINRAFASKIIHPKSFEINTNYHGGNRAYVVTGEYEKVCPLDILPQLLIKAIMAGDIEKMENLGIYEVIEEDFALCEFVCTSKTDVQTILREGLDIIRKEMS